MAQSIVVICYWVLKPVYVRTTSLLSHIITLMMNTRTFLLFILLQKRNLRCTTFSSTYDKSRTHFLSWCRGFSVLLRVTFPDFLEEPITIVDIEAINKSKLAGVLDSYMEGVGDSDSDIDGHLQPIVEEL